jgi:hypothetical protein
MVKKLLIATAASGLMLSTALAQQTTTPPAAAPSAPAASTSAGGATASSAKFIPSQGKDQWVASKFKGTDVIGANNEKIGDVDDMLFDKNGKVLAFIVGVGGFLGIGQKDVALDMAAFQVVPADTGSNTGATGSTSANDDPHNIKLKLSMTKDELKAAPAFEYYRSAARTTGAAPGSNTGTTRPAPATNR